MAGSDNGEGNRIAVTYGFRGSAADAEERARELALEQTVELPGSLVPPGFIQDGIVGKIERIESADGAERHFVTVSFDQESAGADFPQFLNLLFGNSSIKPGIRIESIALPESFARRFPGPRFGAGGLREIAGVERRPLTCTALKPMGLSPRELAELAYRFAAGGIDFIKDDHGIANQSFSPFSERLARCVEAVEKANRETGGRSRYVPNVTGPADAVFERAREAQRAGAGGVLIAPGLTGFDAMRALAEDESFGLPIFSHPAFLGSFVASQDSGISHGVLFGTITRLAGADASVFPNYGGRFAFTAADCADLARACRSPLAGRKQTLPVPAGGMSVERAGEMTAAYGRDFIALIGGALQNGGDIEGNARSLTARLETVA